MDGTELYVKIEKDRISDQFIGGTGNSWKELTLWFGKTKVTDKHTLWPWGNGNKYSLVEGVGRGQYQLESGEVVNEGDVETRIRTGNYGYVTLGDEGWRRTYNWASFLTFDSKSCRYRRNEKFEMNKWTITVRCVYGSYDWENSERERNGSLVDFTLTKDN